MAGREFAAQRHRSAFNYLFAEFVSNDKDARTNYEEMQYVAGLKRPMAAIRWGVGVDYQAGNYEGDPHPIGSGKQVAQTNRERGGGGFEPGGAGAGFGVGAPGGFEPTGPGFGGPPGGFGGAGGGAAPSAGISDPDIARTTGEVGDRVLGLLKSKVESGDFGAALKDYAGITPSQGGSGFGGFGGQDGGFPGAPGGFPGAPGGFPGAPGGFEPGGIAPGGFEPGGVAPGGAPGGFPATPGFPGAPGGFGGQGQARPAAGPHQLMPGIVALGQGKADELVKRAQQEQLDVLLVFQVSVDENRRTKIVTNTVRFAFYDVATGELFKDAAIRALTNTTVEKEREKKSDKDLVADALGQITQFIDTQFAFSPLPSEFGHDQAIERIRNLLGSQAARKVENLNEIRFYRSRQLLSNDELIKAYEHAIGDAGLAAQLASGSEDAKKKAMEELLAKLK